jgi:hypothetical protein
VTSAATEYIGGLGDVVTFMTASGPYGAVNGAGAAPTSTTVPADAVAVSFRYYLTPSGDLYYFNGTLISSDVTGAHSDYVDGYGDLLTFSTTSGAFFGSGAAPGTALPAVPSTARSVGFRHFLDIDGSLYYQDGRKIADGVTSATADYIDTVGDFLTFTTATGAFIGVNGGSVQPQPSAIPAGSTAVGIRHYLAPNGDLYYANGTIVASNVTSASAEYVNGVGDLLTFSYRTTC